MNRTKSIAAAAAFAAFSLPAFASEPTSAISDDPTQPAMGRLAPAFVIQQREAEESRAALAGDPTWVDAGQSAPRMVLTLERKPVRADPDEVASLPVAHCSLELAVGQPAVALHR